jgi:hypothetical protein
VRRLRVQGGCGGRRIADVREDSLTYKFRGALKNRVWTFGCTPGVSPPRSRYWGINRRTEYTLCHDTRDNCVCEGSYQCVCTCACACIWMYVLCAWYQIFLSSVRNVYERVTDLEIVVEVLNLSRGSDKLIECKRDIIKLTRYLLPHLVSVDPILWQGWSEL